MLDEDNAYVGRKCLSFSKIRLFCEENEESGNVSEGWIYVNKFKICRHFLQANETSSFLIYFEHIKSFAWKK